MTSKLTTICGAIGIAATGVATCNFGPLTTKIALCVSGIAGSLGLFFARDNKVTDEASGAIAKEAATQFKQKPN